MKVLFQSLAVVAFLLLDASPAGAADCACEELSREGCVENVSVFEVAATPPLWCERSDDPRCMPANTHGTSTATLVPVAMSWTRPIRWSPPPRTAVIADFYVGGGPRTEHSRRVERPPR